MGWESFGNVTVRDDGPFERNPHYVRLTPAGHGHKSTGLSNEGFFGVAFRKGETYRFSVWARTQADGKKSKIRVELTDPASMGETQVMASQTIEIDSKEWKRYTATLTPSATVAKGRLRVFLDSGNGCDLEHISLFPADTWKGHENGLRKDLAQKLADIHPGLLRFPGGCIVEGTACRHATNGKQCRAGRKPSAQRKPMALHLPPPLLPRLLPELRTRIFRIFPACRGNRS